MLQNERSKEGPNSTSLEVTAAGTVITPSSDNSSMLILVALVLIAIVFIAVQFVLYKRKGKK
jgi:hypothetical protein